MLTCRNVADRASALIDGELSAWDALQTRLHLAICAGCTRFIDHIRATDRVTSEIAESDDALQHEAEHGRFAEVLSMLRRERQQRR